MRFFSPCGTMSKTALGRKIVRRKQMMFDYIPKGVCARKFTIQVEDGLIQSVQVVGGCSGNLQGISMLLKGMPVEEAIRRMEGIRCGSKATSCPDQLAQALKAGPGLRLSRFRT